MKNVYSIILVLILFGCKSTENMLKDTIRLDYPSKNICFRIDQSESVASFGTHLFLKKDYKNGSKDSFNRNFENFEDCELVGLTGKIGDSIYVSIVYPYKKDINQSFDEYPKWFYSAKVYYMFLKDKKVIIDTISIEHNPPIINPRIIEEIELKLPQSLGKKEEKIIKKALNN